MIVHEVLVPQRYIDFLKVNWRYANRSWPKCCGRSCIPDLDSVPENTEKIEGGTRASVYASKKALRGLEEYGKIEEVYKVVIQDGWSITLCGSCAEEVIDKKFQISENIRKV